MRSQEQSVSNRCFLASQAGDSPKQNPATEPVKRVLIEGQERKQANRVIDLLLENFRGKKRIIDLLPVIKLRCSRVVLQVALERVERKRASLAIKDVIFLEAFKKSLESE